ncbi:MAG: hypothetical protein B7Y90_04285 [Alphaproteobacteria bacterium 32-64-14]|nr:MAG: hypothetical protein B7Y90_04285 [Alphaproteobacteria bacterium 32-64-14]
MAWSCARRSISAQSLARIWMRLTRSTSERARAGRWKDFLPGMKRSFAIWWARAAMVRRKVAS